MLSHLRDRRTMKVLNNKWFCLYVFILMLRQGRDQRTMKVLNNKWFCLFVFILMWSQGRHQRTMKVLNNNWFFLLPVHTCVAESAWNEGYMCHWEAFIFEHVPCTAGGVYVPCIYYNKNIYKNLKQECLLAFEYKIQAYKRFKWTLLIRFCLFFINKVLLNLFTCLYLVITRMPRESYRRRLRSFVAAFVLRHSNAD